MNGAIFRDSDGKAISFAWPGGYPVVHVMNDGEILCADCVNDPSNPVHEGGEGDGWRIEGSQIHYEGPDEVCAHCGKVIPSAYGDPDAPCCCVLGDHERSEASYCDPADCERHHGEVE